MPNEDSRQRICGSEDSNPSGRVGPRSGLGDRAFVWQPALATEWQQIYPLTMRLKLRRGVTFRNS